MKRWMMIPLMACLPMIAGCFSTSKSRGLPGGGSSRFYVIDPEQLESLREVA